MTVPCRRHIRQWSKGHIATGRLGRIGQVVGEDFVMIIGDIFTNKVTKFFIVFIPLG